MQDLTEDQIQALRVRAALAGAPFRGREAKGVRDAQAALAALLTRSGADPAALARDLRAYLAQGPAWDSQDYYDGGESVHRDVAAVLGGNQIVILDLLDALAHTAAPDAAPKGE